MSKLTDEECVKLLLRAADLVEIGWCQDAAARDAKGRMVLPSCVSAAAWDWAGAVERAYVEHTGAEAPWRGEYGPHGELMPRSIFQPLIERMTPVLKAHGWWPMKNGAEWNNDPARKREDIITVLREAAL